MFDLSDLLAESMAIRSNGAVAGHSRGGSSTVVAWLIAGAVAAIYFALAVLAIKSPVPEELQLVAGPTTWTGLLSMAVMIFIAVGGGLTAFQWTMTHGSRRRYRPRQRRPLDV